MSLYDFFNLNVKKSRRKAMQHVKRALETEQESKQRRLADAT